MRNALPGFLAFSLCKRARSSFVKCAYWEYTKTHTRMPFYWLQFAIDTFRWNTTALAILFIQSHYLLFHRFDWNPNVTYYRCDLWFSARISENIYSSEMRTTAYRFIFRCINIVPWSGRSVATLVVRFVWIDESRRIVHSIAAWRAWTIFSSWSRMTVVLSVWLSKVGILILMVLMVNTRSTESFLTFITLRLKAIANTHTRTQTRKKLRKH